MRTRALASVVAIAALVVSAGCSGSKPNGGTAGAGSAAPPDADQAILDEIPTQDEADAAAAAEITDENAEAELRRLASEIEREIDDAR